MAHYRLPGTGTNPPDGSGFGATLCGELAPESEIVADTVAIVGCDKCTGLVAATRTPSPPDPEMDAWQVAVIATLGDNPWINQRPHGVRAIQDMLDCYRNYRAANGYNELQIGEVEG